MNAQHTPGPWFQTVDAEVRDAEDGLIADVFGVNNSNELANTRLIAAAPDLLAVLPQLLVNMKGDGHDYRDCYKAGLAAIAKATGAV